MAENCITHKAVFHSLSSSPVGVDATKPTKTQRVATAILFRIGFDFMPATEPVERERSLTATADRSRSDREPAAWRHSKSPAHGCPDAP
jgi:hypothetical protein